MTDNTTTIDKKTRTRNAILDAAQELFLAKGYYSTDIPGIAKKAGIDKRTIYRYFSSKEALAFVIWQRVLVFVTSFGAEAIGDNGFMRLSYVLHHYMMGVKDNQNIVRFLGEFDNIFSGDYPQIEEADEFFSYVSSQKNNIISKHIKDGIKDGSIRSDVDVELTASTISNILLAISQRVVKRGEHLKQEQGYSFEILDECVEILLKGMENKEKVISNKE